MQKQFAEKVREERESPRGLRRVETQLEKSDLEKLKGTLASDNREALIMALEKSISLYEGLREML